MVFLDSERALGTLGRAVDGGISLVGACFWHLARDVNGGIPRVGA